jgi:hypothetical protein
MPKPASPYKKIFLESYPTLVNLFPRRRSLIQDTLEKWRLKPPPEFQGRQVTRPDARTMRLWRAEVESVREEVESVREERWIDEPWDGKSAGHVPIGWLWGLDWFARSTEWEKPLTQTQAEHAQRLYTSLEDLDLSAVWVLVNEFTIQDQIRYSYGEAYFERFTTIDSLNAIIAFKPWRSRNTKQYLQWTDALPPTGEPDPDAVRVRQHRYSRSLGPPFFLTIRFEQTFSIDGEFMAQLVVHLSHLIGNPFDDARSVAQYLPAEVIKQFKNDVYKGMSWQEILVKEYMNE